MATDLCILMRRPPYGSIFAAEGIRHLIGAMANGLNVSAVLMDDGVWTLGPARVPERPAGPRFPRRSRTPFGSPDGPAPQILADGNALTSVGLRAEDLVPGVRVASRKAVAEVVATARQLIIF